MVEQKRIPTRYVYHLSLPQYRLHCGQIHLLRIDQFDSCQPVKRTDGVIEPMIHIQPSLWQKGHHRIGFVFEIRAARFQHPANITITGSGEEMQYAHAVRMIGAFFVTMIVCSNWAAIALSDVRNDQPSLSSTIRPTPVVRNGSTARTSPSFNTRRSRGLK